MLAPVERRRIKLVARNSNDADMLTWKMRKCSQILTWQTDADVASKLVPQQKHMLSARISTKKNKSKCTTRNVPTCL